LAEGSPEFRRISDDSVRRRTGKGWADWLEILDEWDATDTDHTGRARHLRDAHGVDPWWAQAVTVRYEYERGLREPKSRG
jgi:hypothetical protein